MCNRADKKSDRSNNQDTSGNQVPDTAGNTILPVLVIDEQSGNSVDNPQKSQDIGKSSEKGERIEPCQSKQRRINNKPEAMGDSLIFL